MEMVLGSPRHMPSSRIKPTRKSMDITDGIDEDERSQITGKKCRQSPSETGLGLFLDSVAIKHGQSSTMRPHHMIDAYRTELRFVSDDGIQQAEAQRTGPAVRQPHNTSAQARRGRGQRSYIQDTRMLMSPHIRLRDVVKSLASGMTISEMMLVLSMQSIDLLQTRHLIRLSVSPHRR